MRDKVKRFISILMTALMLVNLLPVGALADGITSIGYRPETVANYNGIVYVYVKVTGNTDGLVLNKDGWYTIGTVSIANMPDPSNYRYSSYGEHVDYVWSTEWFSNKIYASSVSGINHERNKTIPLDKVKWTGTVGDQSFGFVRVNSGATDYPNASKYTWHLDGYVNVKDVNATYKIRYVNQDTKEVLKEEAKTGEGKLGATITYNEAPYKFIYNEKEYTRQGEPNQTFTFTLVSPENTFNIYYRRPYGYTVEYYYDDVKDDKKTETGSAWCNEQITKYDDKMPKVGYELDKTKTTKLPLTIGTNESKNVIKVYYKKIGYTVTYEPDEHGDFKARAYNAKHGDATPAFDGETTGKPGWKFDGWEPEVAKTVTGNATYTAKFVPDEKQTATVLCTIDEKQIGYGTVYPSIYQTILQATGKLKGGKPISGSMATANAGYKFVGWYKVTGEETYEWVTGDPDLKQEMAESKLNRDEKTGLYQNTVFVARFEPDAGAKVPVTYEAENGTLKGTTSQEAQIVTGDGLTDVEATPNTGYKFDGWYAVDKNGDKHLISGLDPAEKLDAKKAKENLNKDGNLYAATTFIARFVPDENQTVPIIYTTDGNGTLWGGPAIGSITYKVNIATGKVWLNNAFVDKLEPVSTYPKEGYEFDRWIRVFPEKTIEDASSTLTDEEARPNLNQEDGLYQKTEFKAIFKPLTNLSYTVNYYWNGTTEKVTESKTVNDQTFEAEVTEHPVEAEGYTPVSTDPKTITIDADSTKNIITFYYYKNVKLTANSDEKTYDGKPKSVSDYTCEVAKVQEDGTVEYVPWTGEKLTFEFVGAFGSGTDAGDYDVTFKEGSVGENNGLYYVKKVQPGTLTIKPAPIKLRAPIASKPYDGTPLKAEDYGYGYEGNTDLADDFKSISVEGSQTMVGSSASSVTYTLKDRKKSQNYDIQCIPGTLTITPVMDEVLVKIKGDTASVTYDGKPHKVDGYAVDSISNPLYTKDDFKYNGDAKAEGTDAGEYKMGLTAEKFTNISDNFTNVTFVVEKDGHLVIEKRKVTLTSANAEKVYDGKPLTKNEVTASGDGFVDGQGATYDVTGTQTNVGETANTFTYTLKDGTNAANYEIKTENGTLKVTPVTDKVTVTITEHSDTVKYDGTEKTVTGYDVDISNPLYTANDFTFSGNAEAKGTDAGTYDMELKPEDFTNNNTNFAEVKFVIVDGKLKINKRSVKLASETASKPYDGTPLTKPEVAVVGDGFVDGEVTELKATGSVTNVSEGEVTNAITFTEGENFKADNYAIEKDEGKLSISKRSVMLTSADLKKVYDGTPLTNGDAPVTEMSGTEKAFPEGEGLDYTFTGSQTDVGKSENKFTFKVNEGTNEKNYSFEVAFGKLEVTPVTDEVIVTITGRTDEMPYDGKDHSVFGYDVTVSNALYNPKEDMQFNGTDVDMTAKGTDAGTYPIGLTAEDFTNKSDNFSKVTFVVTDGYVKINPRAVTLTSETAGKTYDGTALEKPVVTVGGDGFVEGQVKEIKATGSVTNAGSVANTITFTPDKETFKDGNYAITKNEGTLTIAKRSVLITSQSATKTYDGSALTRPAVTITGDGFVPGELAKAEATGSITNVGSIPNAIQYTTTGAFNAANYSIALSVGTLTVTEKPQPEPRRTFNLTVNYVYQNGKRAAASYNRGGLKNGETFDITSPVIAGYTASETVVSGTIYNRDIKVTVIYTADGVNLDDYGVPLGLGNITMNVGDCFE